jgi:hypothetical protein
MVWLYYRAVDHESLVVAHMRREFLKVLVAYGS